MSIHMKTQNTAFRERNLVIGNTIEEKVFSDYPVEFGILNHKKCFKLIRRVLF